MYPLTLSSSSSKSEAWKAFTTIALATAGMLIAELVSDEISLPPLLLN